jgi:hypothetical protein
MLGALFAVGTEGSGSLRHGHTTLPAHREHLHYLVTSTEQGKPVSLPARGSEAARRSDDDAGMRGERKRRPLCNGTDIGCVGIRNHITECESMLTSLWCFTRENLTNRLTRQGR